MAKKNKLPIAKTSVSPAMPNAAVEDMQYRAKAALDDITRAETHKGDSELMEQVKKLGKAKMAALKKVCT